MDDIKVEKKVPENETGPSSGMTLKTKVWKNVSRSKLFK